MSTMPSIDQADITAQDAQIDALLRADAAQWRADYIDNAGFSDGVIAAINAQPSAQAGTARNVGRRLAVVGGAIALGVVVAAVPGGGANVFIDAAMDLATRTITPAVIGLALLAICASTMAMVAASHER
jgi:hypothetical protein